ncbi:MAG: WD40 repeat domain-containing protein [Bryobacteraceae bacterium]|nr:WD40 repeat domain-containing protein [Bryobacteraceae bacterium]
MAIDRTIACEATVHAVAFCGDNLSLAGACSDHKVRVWEMAKGSVSRTVTLDEGYRVADMPSGRDLVAAMNREGQIKTWNLQTGKVGITLPGSTPQTSDLAISPDRRYLVTSNGAAGNGSEETIHVWETDARERVAMPGGIGGTAAFAISPDNSTIVASSYDANVRAWNARNGELLALIEQLPVAMFAMGFSPDGARLATGGADRVVYLWDTKTWKLLRKFAPHREMISALAFSPSGKHLLTGGFNVITVKHPVDVILHEVASGKIVRTETAAHQVSSIAISPDGKWAAFADGQKSVSLLKMPV